MKKVLMPRPGNARRRTLALLGGLCFFLSALEYIIPRPLPFMRIGLANLPLLLALDILGAGDFFILALLKVLGQGIISGSLFSYVFLFSLAGTFSSALLMYLLRKLCGKKYSGFVGIGCAGAMISNGVQLLLARYLIFGASLRYLAPPFLASGFVTGAGLGIFCEYFCRRSRWYAGHTAGTGEGGAQADTAGGEESPAAVSPSAAAPALRASVFEQRRARRRQRWNEIFDSRALFFFGILMAALIVFLPSLTASAALFAVFCVLAWVSGKKINAAFTVIVMAGIVFFNLLVPYGKVLAELGPLRVTRGSLIAGLRKAFVLEGLFMLSGFCVKSDLRLPGKFGALLAESLRLLELLKERKNSLRRGHVIEGIDRIMLELETADRAGEVN